MKSSGGKGQGSPVVSELEDSVVLLRAISQEGQAVLLIWPVCSSQEFAAQAFCVVLDAGIDVGDPKVHLHLRNPCRQSPANAQMKTPERDFEPSDAVVMHCLPSFRNLNGDHGWHDNPHQL